ncbi:MAG: M28 family peptidase [Flavobacteriales bacterium]|nr:M28 family peptidase [Flavobacteriales bacterium]
MPKKRKNMLKMFIALLPVLCGGIIWSVTQPTLIKPEQVETPEVSPKSLEQMVRIMTDHEVARNYKNIERLNEVAEYIHETFSSYSNDVSYQKYNIEGVEYKNVIASFGPKEGERIVIGAHYDVCGDQPGADDNATGTVGLLELARLLKSQNLKYRVDLVAYTLEEPPYFRTEYMGSAVHAKYLKENNIKLKGMYCLEMIGYFSDEPGSQNYPVAPLKAFYPSTGDYIAIVGKTGQGKFTKRAKKDIKSAAGIDVRSINAPKFVTGIDFSDHLNYWAEGYKAVMITNTSFYRNQNYHQPTDLPESLDYDKMAEVIKGVYQIIVAA